MASGLPATRALNRLFELTVFIRIAGHAEAQRNSETLNFYIPHTVWPAIRRTANAVMIFVYQYAGAGFHHLGGFIVEFRKPLPFDWEGRFPYIVGPLKSKIL